MNKKIVSVPNMSCGHCVHTIETELSELAGIKDVKANLANKSVEIEWDNPADWTQITDLLKDINYPAAE